MYLIILCMIQLHLINKISKRLPIFPSHDRTLQGIDSIQYIPHR